MGLFFKDKIAKELENKKESIRFRAPISGANWGYISITSLNGSPISCETPIRNSKFRFQTLFSGANFEEGNYRIDNSHGTLHQHSLGSISFLENISTVSGALTRVLGSEFIDI